MHWQPKGSLPLNSHQFLINCNGFETNNLKLKLAVNLNQSVKVAKIQNPLQCLIGYSPGPNDHDKDKHPLSLVDICTYRKLRKQ